MKIFSALDPSLPYPFHKIIPESKGVFFPDDIDGPGVLVIWGGGDISPSFYGQQPGPHTGADATPSRQDTLEANLAKRAIEMGVPIVGVCRGAQLLCAIGGGKLIQHINNHGRSHGIKTYDGREMVTASLHHQMMFPFDVEYEMLAWSNPPLSKEYLGEKGEPVDGISLEPEMFWMPGVKTLCIQGHPEFMDDKSPFVQFVFEQMKRFIHVQI